MQLATPFFVNLLLFVPLVIFIYFRKNQLEVGYKNLWFVAIFGTAFGFVEAAVVIYLRASTNLLPGFQGTLLDVQKHAFDISYNQQILSYKLPISLLTIEFFREIATIIMLLTISLIAANKLKERIAVYLFAFAFWDLFYYVFLYLTVRWPGSFTTKDLLFLIPTPWFSQVWLPILVSSLTIIVIAVQAKKEK